MPMTLCSQVHILRAGFSVLFYCLFYFQVQKSDMSAWFNLFADLDPLSDPDAVGRPDKESNAA